MSNHRGLVEAFAVYWYENVQLESVSLVDNVTPENRYMLKEIMSKFSDDAKLFTSVILDLPDDMITSLGKPIFKLIVPYMKKNYGWKGERVSLVQAEISQLFS